MWPAATTSWASPSTTPGDEVVVRHSDIPGLRITKITGDDGRLPRDPEQNTAGVAALDLLRHLGMSDRGIEMEIHKNMPFGSGPRVAPPPARWPGPSRSTP